MKVCHTNFFFGLLIIVSCSSDNFNYTYQPEDFFANVPVTKVKISPEGAYISYVNSDGDPYHLVLKENGSDSLICISPTEGKEILNYFWVYDSVLFYIEGNIEAEKYCMYRYSTIERNKSLITKLGDRDASLLFVSADSCYYGITNKGDILYFKSYDQAVKRDFLEECRIFDVIHGCTNNFLIGINIEDTLLRVMFRKGQDFSFHPLFHFSYEDIFKPLFFDNSDTIFYALSNIGRDKTALVKYDPISNRETECIYEHKDFDMKDVYYSYFPHEVTNLYFQTWKNENVIFNENIKKAHCLFTDDTMNYSIVLVSATRSLDKQVWFLTDPQGFKYYIYDATVDSLILFTEYTPWKNQRHIPETRPFSFLTTDSTRIYGYITFPKTTEDYKPPLIVYPHGGPFLENEKYEYMRDLQYFASQGYAVMLVNFRGSGGFGKKFFKKGEKQWAGKILDDIVEATDYVLKNYPVDSSRVAMLGLSYGGYASLMIPIRYPKRFKCAVSVCGVTDIPSFIRYRSNSNYSSYYFRETLGDIETDSSYLASISPINLADKMNIPVLLMHGKNDDIVEPRQTEMMYHFLLTNKKDVNLYMIDNARHGDFSNEQNYSNMCIITEFLARYLK